MSALVFALTSYSFAVQGQADPQGPMIGGHAIAPQLADLPAWDEPVRLQPEAPDMAQMCSGSWGELTYSSDADLASSSSTTQAVVDAGHPNVRFYIEPGEYFESLRPQDAQCIEIVGKPRNGQNPMFHEGFRLRPPSGRPRGGMIVRNIDFAEHRYPVGEGVIVLHNVHVPAWSSAVGTSDVTAPETYLEIVNSLIGPCLTWHCLYTERSVGIFVGVGNIFYGSRPASHAAKILAHTVRLEGNIFSNVGLDGQPLLRDGREIIGLFPLDVYGCGRSDIRNNTFIFRWSKNNIQTFQSLRARGAWGGCDRGKRNPGGTYQLLPPESPAYSDPAVWQAVAKARQDMRNGYAVAYANPWLFTHRLEGNTYYYLNPGGVGLAPPVRIDSLRPASDGTRRREIYSEANALAGRYTDDEAAWRAAASEGLEYVHDTVKAQWQRNIRRVGRPAMMHTPPLPHPEGWNSRVVLFTGNHTYRSCNMDGSACEELATPAPAFSTRPEDTLAVAHPATIVSPD